MRIANVQELQNTVKQLELTLETRVTEGGKMKSFQAEIEACIFTRLYDRGNALLILKISKQFLDDLLLFILSGNHWFYVT